MLPGPEVSDDEVDASAPPTIAPGEPAWLTFEKDVSNFLASLDPGATVIHNKKRHGKSGRLRQMDALITGDVCGSAVEIAVEAKHYSKKVGIGVVDAFVGKCVDVEVDKGILYSHLGFDDGAVARAAAAVHPKIELREVPEPASVTLSDSEIAILLADLEPWDVVTPKFLGVRACPGDECWGDFVATEDWDGGICDQCGLPVGVCQECDGSTRLESDEQICDHCDSGAFMVDREHGSQVLTDIHWMSGLWDH
ncbi:restriction endonuclease [Nocardioides dubius]|uniref:Restriction endonuclease type IV Mrr domain-containing protein n=1 Tax=Nocardioides dubius TaxID=317019 RepID=A0ABP4EBL3_9ACTN